MEQESTCTELAEANLGSCTNARNHNGDLQEVQDACYDRHPWRIQIQFDKATLVVDPTN